jgi:hypothetical protein
MNTINLTDEQTKSLDDAARAAVRACDELVASLGGDVNLEFAAKQLFTRMDEIVNVRNKNRGTIEALRAELPGAEQRGDVGAVAEINAQIEALSA